MTGLARLRCMLMVMGVSLLSVEGCKSQAPTSATAATNSIRQPHRPSDESIRLAFEQMPAYDRLEVFGSEAEFYWYRKRIEQIAGSHGLSWLTYAPNMLKPILLAAAETEPCDPDTEGCLNELEEVVTTGQRASR